MNVLVLNPGSSTLKYAVYSSGNVVQSATIPLATDRWTTPDENRPTLLDATQVAIQTVAKELARQPDIIGYRIVHGGRRFSGPTRIDEAVLQGIRSLVDLAPLHQPYGVAAVEMSLAMYPSQCHVACFDTAFHSCLPEREKRLPIPNRFYESGVQRYGFHGLSYESIANQLRVSYPEIADSRVVVCHLGNGASVCGMRELKSCYTSMSFTPLDGLIMGTRSGQMDPGVILHWLRLGYTADEVETILLKESGLLASSGVSSDMRDLLALSSTSEECQFAIDQFCIAVAKHIAIAATSLGGINAIVFTAGIGENCPEIRRRVLENLKWLGIRIDEQSNLKNEESLLHDPASSIAVLKLTTDEQLVIANQSEMVFLTASNHEDS